MGMITVMLPLSAFTNVILCLCAFSLSLMAVCISELWLLLSGVLCTPIVLFILCLDVLVLCFVYLFLCQL